MDSVLKSIENLRNHAQHSGEKGLNFNSKQKPMLLNQTTYQLNKSKTKFVSVGMVCGSNFSPAIVLYGCKNDFTIFDESEWIAILENQGVITNYFISKHEIFQPLTLKTKTIFFQTIGGKKVVSIRDQRGSEIFFGLETVAELWELLSMIAFKIEILKSQEFYQFYTSIVRGLVNLPGDIRTNIEHVIEPLKQAKSQNALCMLELLKYAEDIIRGDIEIEQIQQAISQSN